MSSSRRPAPGRPAFSGAGHCPPREGPTGGVLSSRWTQPEAHRRRPAPRDRPIPDDHYGGVMSREFGPRRSTWLEVTRPDDSLSETSSSSTSPATTWSIARSAPSSTTTPSRGTRAGRFSRALCSRRPVRAMDYDIGHPNRDDADLLSYSAGHKALGLYAMLALRDEVVRIGDPGALPAEDRLRLRFEDLLGFRRNPTQPTPLFRQFRSKALDGHPTPATPFVKLATGASGVGFGSSLGLALGAADFYGTDPPGAHRRGRGRHDPRPGGRGTAFAGTAGLRNAIVHLDWNQASIDFQTRSPRDGERPATTCSGTPASLSTCTTGTWSRSPTASMSRWSSPPSGAPWSWTRASRPPSFTAPRRAGSTASRDASRTEPATKLCSPEFRATLEPLLGPGAPGLPAATTSAAATGRNLAEVERC